MSTGRAASSSRWSAAARAGAALLILAVGGCTAMRPVKQPANYIEAVQPKLIRVTRTDGTKFNMIGAHLSGDTLMGFVQKPSGVMGEFEEMPLGDLQKVEAQQYAHGLTALAILGGVAAWAGITYVFIKSIESGSN